jgi:SpoIID/LytB domain protein
MSRYALRTLLWTALAALVASPALAADETSSGDKLRMLYSNQFTFTDDGLPVVTIELASGRKRVELGAKSGLLVKPDGESGAAIRAGKNWVITLEDAQPAKLREWTVVGRFHPDESSAIDRAYRTWKSRGFSPKSFEIGTLFGVSGAVLDSRETLVAIAPTGKGRGKSKARTIARKYDLKTSVHTEVVKLPRGTVIARSGGVTITNPSLIWFYPSDDDGTIEVKDIEVGGGGSQLATRKENRRYFGGVYATIGKDGKLVVVNAVSTDRLLAGIVPSEIFPSAPPAALRAQAVAARTELLEKLGRRHFGDPFLLCSTQQCQVYSGAGKEHPRTTAAVKATRGVVLMGTDKHLVDARYSAACGGHTESKQNIWGGSPDAHLRGVVDAIPGTPSFKRFARGIDKSNLRAFLDAPASEFFEGTSRFGKGRFRWEKTLTTDELTRRVAAKYPGLGRITSLEPLSRGASGRIGKIRITGTTGTAIANGDLHLRRLFGGLRSSLFVVEKVGPNSAPTAFRFRGAGFGHGVGMCQVGAIGRAEHKQSYEQILRHYYQGASLKRLY